jgi:hypothetical protein
MSYHDLSSCTLTDDERRAEATRIVGMIGDLTDVMLPHERKFMEQVSDVYATVSVKQLFWLRDLKDKYA